MTKAALVARICELAGPGTTLVDAATGWPGIVDVLLPAGGNVRVFLHASTVGPHARRDYEFRFQNPGDRRPVSARPNGFPILVGVADLDGRTILVAVDGKSRLGRVARFSILFNVNVMRGALAKGWERYQSSNGERIYAFTPELFPVYVELVRDGIDGEISEAANQSIQLAVSASGLLDEWTNAASIRARRAANILIRKYAFGGNVVQAYGSVCSMCGLNTGLVVGAHIMPVAAPGAPDEIWNGLALCHNHHAAFDLHKIWVNPETRAVTYRPDVLDEAKAKPALAAFLANTYDELYPPMENRHMPRESMFVARYRFFENQYQWV